MGANLQKANIDFRRMFCRQMDRGGDRLRWLTVAHGQAELSHRRERENVCSDNMGF